jgi:hypothetical protein
MDVQDSSAAIYSEAKSEYTDQLVFNFQPALLRFFVDRFTEVKASDVVTSKTKSALSEFQNSLSQIPDWNLDKVHSETSELLKAIHCDYIEDLITAVFIAHTKILSAIRLHSKPRRKINITVPKPDHFMHRTMSECSRFLWSNVYLFDDTVPSVDRQKNMNEVNHFLEKGILQAIRNLLPVKSILRDSLQEDDDDAIQVNTQDEIVETPLVSKVEEAKPEEVKVEEVKPEEPKVEEAKSEEQKVEPKVEPKVELKALEVSETPRVVEVTKNPETLVIDTEKSVGFTGFDSIFGTTGEAEMKPMTEEGDDELKIIGDLEELSVDDIEDLDKPMATNTPLAADDYESL